MEFVNFSWPQIVVFFTSTILVYISVAAKRFLNWCKLLWTRYRLGQREKIELDESAEMASEITHVGSFDSQTIWATDMNSCSLYIKFERKVGNMAEIAIVLRLPNGDVYHSSGLPNTLVLDSADNSWSAGDLKLVPLEPFTRWRILFNGIMIKKGDGLRKESIPHHVRMHFIWIVASDPLRIPDDCSLDLLADAVASDSRRDADWLIKNYPLKGYDQFGNLSGFIKINDDTEPQVYSLVGFKKRRWGNFMGSFLKKYINLSGVIDDGMVYDVCLTTNDTGSLFLLSGFVRNPNSAVTPIDTMDIDSDKLFKLISNEECVFEIKAGTKLFKLKTHMTNTNTFLSRGEQPWKWENKILPLVAQINNNKGVGLLESWSLCAEQLRIDDLIQNNKLRFLELKEIDTEAICVEFSNRAAKCAQFVGAKAASLALLSSVETQKYKVPNGFCLTTKALELQLAAREKILDALEEIKSVNLKYSEIDLKDCCEKVQKMIIDSSLDPRVKKGIDSNFVKLLSANKNHETDCFYAVRSSGIGEDSDDYSAAGQNATILGCTSLADIYKAILKCWSSLFTFQSVEYRRQHGQSVDCGMGVVIQEMVDARSAGVMFSRHPTTGDPSCILITSAFGLGETVVSGQVEPDHIYVNRDLENQLSIKNITVGKKTHKISLDKSCNTKTEAVIESNQRSVTDNECLSLASVAVMQEHLWGSPRDIEWAISQGQIYLVQARPITSLQNWSEYELLHEFDTAIMSDQDFHSFANLGEIMPTASSPLSGSISLKSTDYIFSEALKENKLKYSPNMLSLTHHRICMDVFKFHHLRVVGKKVTSTNKIADLSLFGHIVTDEKIRSIAERRNGIAGLSFILETIRLSAKNILNRGWAAKGAEDYCEKFNIDLVDCHTSQDMYEKIDFNLLSMPKAFRYHIVTSGASSITQFILFSIIMKGKDDLTPENFADIGLILSNSANVISGEIPEKLSKLTQTIADSGKSEEFLAIDHMEGIDWLKKNCSEIYDEITDFLEKHGHRAYFEVDLMTQTWSMQPENLIKVLQTNLSNPQKDRKQTMNVEQILNNLSTPLGALSKMILKFMIPICQHSVACRESTKSTLTRAVHKYRLAYRKLARQMVKEWRIPDENLLFFMTHSELGRYLNTRDPTYVNKATLRQRYYPKWCAYKFEELIWGVPKPISTDDSSNLEINAGEKLTGTPVYSGKVTGRACVIRNFSEIDELKKGDILVTHSTDVGWSPYFPLVKGVVTELGGLISHGAVIAREYGLPCVVGVQNATRHFRTGDNILLNADEGFLYKL